MDPVRSWPRTPLVADASVWINITAGGFAPLILEALGEKPQITRIALNELERGRDKGRKTAESLAVLIRAGLVTVADLPEAADEIYLSLVAGPVSTTLDDGEAATLALALFGKGTAVIDERKAIGLAASRFPSLPTITTTDLLMSKKVRSVLTRTGLRDILYAALTEARMRVPDHLLMQVCDCLGPERTALCLSLPARVRSGPRN